MHWHVGSTSAERVGQEEVGGITPLGAVHGAVHMVAAKLGCQKAMVGTGWAISSSVCMEGLENTTFIF